MTVVNPFGGGSGGAGGKATLPLLVKSHTEGEKAINSDEQSSEPSQMFNHERVEAGIVDRVESEQSVNSEIHINDKLDLIRKMTINTQSNWVGELDQALRLSYEHPWNLISRNVDQRNQLKINISGKVAKKITDADLKVNAFQINPSAWNKSQIIRDVFRVDVQPEIIESGVGIGELAGTPEPRDEPFARERSKTDHLAFPSLLRNEQVTVS